MPRIVRGGQVYRSQPYQVGESGPEMIVPKQTGEIIPNVPDGTIAEVLEWAGDNPRRRAAALVAENHGKKRKGVLDALSE